MSTDNDQISCTFTFPDEPELPPESSEILNCRVASRNFPRTLPSEPRTRLAPFEESNVHLPLSSRRFQDCQDVEPDRDHLGQKTSRNEQRGESRLRVSADVAAILPPSRIASPRILIAFPSKFSREVEGKLSQLGANERELSSPESEP
ncbi:hypothetical protein K0M31_002974 [Melipona bicolor]|uniref:Uncharacterized protein n=1 Tax=Melipona bicolor TaxID=60889 RepID=A0AA40G011_9HYME|nr:hypothetical protein K0M31_002974 [Melipona bicolor]